MSRLNKKAFRIVRGSVPLIPLEKNGMMDSLLVMMLGCLFVPVIKRTEYMLQISFAMLVKKRQ